MTKYKETSVAVKGDFTTSETATVCCSTNKYVASRAPKNQKNWCTSPFFKCGNLIEYVYRISTMYGREEN
jgi:hypothetical protein